jgi:hypothetical protein
MKANVGGVDKVVRLVLAAALFSLFFLLEGNARWFAAIGVVPLATTLLSWCPLYTILGINTCPMKRGMA